MREAPRGMFNNTHPSLSGMHPRLLIHLLPNIPKSTCACRFGFTPPVHVAPVQKLNLIIITTFVERRVALQRARLNVTLAVQCSNPVEVPSGQPDTVLTQPQDWQLQLSIFWLSVASSSEVVTKVCDNFAAAASIRGLRSKRPRRPF